MGQKVFRLVTTSGGVCGQPSDGAWLNPKFEVRNQITNRRTQIPDQVTKLKSQMPSFVSFHPPESIPADEYAALECLGRVGKELIQRRDIDTQARKHLNLRPDERFGVHVNLGSRSNQNVTPKVAIQVANETDSGSARVRWLYEGIKISQ